MVYPGEACDVMEIVEVQGVATSVIPCEQEYRDFPTIPAQVHEVERHDELGA